MNIAEILRGLADKVEQINSSESPQSVGLSQVATDNDENSDVNTQPMVGPLQQKLELLKKAAGVDSAYDDGQVLDNVEACDDCGADPCECDGEEDPLSAMKKMAGLPVVVQLSGEDNDIEG